MEKVEKALLDYATATLALPGQVESGDRHFVKLCPPEAVVAVVDGLGHGQGAAAAAKMAIDALTGFRGDSVITLLQHCHRMLRATRGVVMSIASFNASDHTMTWLGVGNVEGALLHRNPHASPYQETLLLRGGVVGVQLPLLAASIVRVTEGDTLILATDGIRASFADRLNLNASPQEIADHILARYGRGNDDALVLVARYQQCSTDVKP
jgi:negative regulator of sigma-B (phosphoserine phosphatase)